MIGDVQKVKELTQIRSDVVDRLRTKALDKSIFKSPQLKKLLRNEDQIH